MPVHLASMVLHVRHAHGQGASSAPCQHRSSDQSPTNSVQSGDFVLGDATDTSAQSNLARVVMLGLDADARPLEVTVSMQRVVTDSTLR